MSLFDANPQTGIPDTAGYPVVHHGHLFSYPDGHPVVDYGSPQPPPADNLPKGESSLAENHRAIWTEALRRLWRQREAKPETPTLTPPPVDPTSYLAYRNMLQAAGERFQQSEWERLNPVVASPIPDYDAVDIPAFENPLQETVFALAEEQEAEARRTQAEPLPLERGSVTYLPDPEDPERDQNGRLVAWYALTVFLVLAAFAAGMLVGLLKGGVQ